MHRLTVDNEAERVVQRRANENCEEANWERTRGGEIEADLACTLRFMFVREQNRKTRGEKKKSQFVTVCENIL